MYKDLILTKENGVATVTLNRPDVLNALTPNTFDELRDVTTQLRDDTEIRVVVLTGAGRAFCSGFDLAVASSIESMAEVVYPMMPILNDTIANLKEMPKATIAKVNGVAAGGGCNIALACDIIIASEQARFVETYLGVPGLHVDGGGSYHLPRTVGIHKALELMFTARSVNAEEAEKLGMANKVVPPDQLDNAVNELASQIASRAPVSLGMTKIALWRGLESDLRTALELEARGMMLACLNDDSREGPQAFLKKRKPNFTGKWKA